MPRIKRFNIRVYGLLIRRRKEILVVDEIISGKLCTKFPGGGVKLGEGITDALIREFEEETENEVSILEHFYTTEDFVQSAFHKREQLISIYYTVKAEGKFELPETQDLEDEFEDFADDEIDFYWLKLKDLDPDDFTFPIDKIVVSKLISKFGKK